MLTFFAINEILLKKICFEGKRIWILDGIALTISIQFSFFFNLHFQTTVGHFEIELTVDLESGLSPVQKSSVSLRKLKSGLLGPKSGPKTDLKWTHRPSFSSTFRFI